MQLCLQASTIVATEAAEVANNAINLVDGDDAILRAEEDSLPGAPS
jgi:hypothetical protein